MKHFRLTDTRLFRSLPESEQLCFKNGLPLRYMGHSIDDMVFIDYSIGFENPKHMSAIRQKKWARKYVKNMSRHNDPGIICCYSSPTDTAAFECAGAIFQAGVKTGMSCVCVSAARVAASLHEIPKNDLYVIYGVTDIPSPTLDRSVTSFLYERDGSQRIVVMSGSDYVSKPWDVAKAQLKIKLDVMLVLNDDNELNTGTIEKIG